MAIAIFILTLILVIWQPRGLGIGYSAMAGAGMALATGVVSLPDIPTVWALLGRAPFTLVALVIIALILEAAGFFQGLALVLARLGMGHGRLLFCLVIIFGALITALFTNYGSALIWTPTVLAMVRLLGFNRRATWAFVFATGFIADATSSALPVSSLVNLITADYFQIRFLRYCLVMVPVNFVAIAFSLVVLWFYYDRDIPKRYNLEKLPPPVTAIRDSLVCRWSLPLLVGLLFISYFVATPLSVITTIATVIILALAGRGFQQNQTTIINIRQISREAPWQVILFTLGMSLIVTGLHHDEITSLLTQQFVKLSSWGVTLAATGTGLLAMLLSSLFNNLPTVLMNALFMPDASQIDPVVREVMVYANVIGCNIGAKITPIGSLATLVWFGIVAGKRFYISWVEYIKVTVMLTLPVLLGSLLALALWLPWLIA